MKIHFAVLGSVFLLLLSVVTSTSGASSRILLLVDPARGLHGSERDLRLLSDFYGIVVDEKDVTVSPRDSTMFWNPNGSTYPLVGVSDYTLETIDTTMLASLRNYVQTGGSVIVFDVSDAIQLGTHAMLQALTDRHVWGAEQRMQPKRMAIFLSSTPELTDVFTGLTFSHSFDAHSNQPTLYDQALDFRADSTITPIMNATDTSGRQFSLFISCSLGRGRIYVSSAREDGVGHSLFADYYGSTWCLSELLPTMVVVKFLYSEKAWHPSGRFANFTLDDLALANVPNFLDYGALLNEMKIHRFHTTIAYIPANYLRGEDSSVTERLFASNANYFSIVQHGDFHSPYEFFGYTSQDSALSCSTMNLCGFNAVPYSQQELLIVDGLTKVSLMQSRIGLEPSRTMVFPWGISPAPTLRLLNKYNFNCTANGMYSPLLSPRDTAWDGWMRPANCDYEGFPLFYRQLIVDPHDSTTIQSCYTFGVFSLFIGMPALYVSHIHQCIPPSSGFNWMADSLNALAFPPEWKSVDYIAMHLYLSKTNDDGSDSAWVFSNKTVLRNSSSLAKVIHVRKREGSNPELRQVLVQGMAQPYSVHSGYVYLDIKVQSSVDAEVDFLHCQGLLDFSATQRDVRADSTGMDVWVHNSGDSAGICSAALIDSSSGTLFDVSSALVGSHDSSVVHFNMVPVLFANSWLILNPLNIGPELNTSNNSLRLSFLPNQGKIRVDDFHYTDSPLNHGWSVVTPGVNGSVSTVFDTSLDKQALEIRTTAGVQFEIKVAYLVSDMGWPRNSFSVKLKTQNPFVFYALCVDSASNSFFVQYSPDDGNTTKSSDYVYIHVGSTYMDGEWNELTRNIDNDIAAAGWPSRVKWIHTFYIRGPMRIDDLVVDNGIASLAGPPAVPTFISPATGATGVPVRSTLRWAAVARAISYAVQVGTDSLFNRRILDAAGIRDTSLLAQNLGYVSRDFWRVRAVNASGASPWSGTGQFTTEAMTVKYAISGKWNIISLPVTDTDNRRSSLFPRAISAAAYKNGYSPCETLQTGRGYWVAFSSPASITIRGKPLTIDTVQLDAGWNLIGSIAIPIPVRMITSVSGSLATSNFWGWAGKYFEADTIWPGRGYWVKVSHAEQLILSANRATSATSRIRIVNSDECPPMIPISDAAIREIPHEFALDQNYPNPFNPETQIRYHLQKTSIVRLDVYDVLGHVVRPLVANVLQVAGAYAVTWSGNDDSGNLVSSGVYFCKLEAYPLDHQSPFVQISKMLLLR